MSTRYLIAALLMTSACVAQADVLPSSSAQSSFLSGWTTGDGTDVVASGVLSNNASLIGGVAYGSDANLAQALYQNASAAAANSGGAVKISYAQGIQGTFLVGTSHALMAAMIGDSISVVGSADGGINVSNAAPQKSAANGAGAPTGSGSSSTSGSGSSTSGASGAGGTTGNNTAGTNGANGTDGTNGTNGTDGTSGSDTLGGTQQIADSGSGSGSGSSAADATSVPEPSSIALLAAGLFGVAGLRRRRSR